MPEVSLPTLEALSDFARDFLRAFPEGAIVGLSGELGAGKTTFVRAILKERAVAEGRLEPRVTSPTYVLHQSYPELGVEHFDLYRLEAAGEAALLELGYFEAVERMRVGRGFLFVEWPEKAAAPRVLGLTAKAKFEASPQGHQVRWEKVTHRSR